MVDSKGVFLDLRDTTLNLRDTILVKRFQFLRYNMEGSKTNC